MTCVLLQLPQQHAFCYIRRVLLEFWSLQKDLGYFLYVTEKNKKNKIRNDLVMAQIFRAILNTFGIQEVLHALNNRILRMLGLRSVSRVNSLLR